MNSNWISKVKSGFNITVSGSSLVEVTVAAVLLSLALGCSLIVFEQVTRSGSTLYQLRQQMWLKDYAEKVKRERRFTSEEITTDAGLHVRQKVSYYQGNTKLLLLEFSLSDEDGTYYEKKPIVTHRELLYKE